MRITLLLVLNGVYMLGHLVVSTRGQQLPFEKSYMWTTESECSLWYFDYGKKSIQMYVASALGGRNPMVSYLNMRRCTLICYI